MVSNKKYFSWIWTWTWILLISNVIANRAAVEELWQQKFEFIDYKLSTNMFSNQSFDLSTNQSVERLKREVDTTFHGHPKTPQEKWHQNFNMEAISAQADYAEKLVVLLNKVVSKYLRACVSIVIYDQYVESTDSIILQTFFQKYEFPYVHGKINENYTLINKRLLEPLDSSCRSYILFLSDVLRTRDVLGSQTRDRVIIVPRSSQWKQQEFLASPLSSDIVNLLVVGESLSVDEKKERPYVMYTHRLYTDGLGSNSPIVLTSWVKGQLSRPHVNLFPTKYLKGFAGHRFIVSTVHQPPYVIKKVVTDGAGNAAIQWDGLEFRILALLGQRLNFTYEIVEPKSRTDKGPTFDVINDVETRRADFGLAGAYVTSDRMKLAEMSVQHSKDCAAFITLASKALPRYRAIMGPFQWPVWVAIIATYLLAIFPLAFSDRLTLSHLIGNWSEMENMFWYVFGTFTNSLTFSGTFSWSYTKKNSTRLLIGFYWMFTIIITACYTSSIIAFVTLPVFPDTVDAISELLSGFYRVGTFEKDGWQDWFLNSSDTQTQRLMKNLELVANVDEGLNNVTKAFFWPYAFIGSRTQLEYIVEGNFPNENLGRSTALHIGDECLSIFGISFIMPRNAVYAERLNDAILRMQHSGLIKKLFRELQWDIQKLRGGGGGALLKASASKQLNLNDVEDRGLTLADTEGMFLLMGIGYLIGASVLMSEVIGGCANKCRQIARRASHVSISESFLPNSSRQTSVSIRGGLLPTVMEPLDDDTNEESLDSSSPVLRLRRQSDQTEVLRVNVLKGILVGHRRHHSLVGGLDRSELQSVLDVARKGASVRFSQEDITEELGHRHLHTVEINRVPTPFCVEEAFGEIVIH